MPHKQRLMFRDMARYGLLAGIIGYFSGVILSGWDWYAAFSGITTALCSMMSRAVHWRFRRFHLERLQMDIKARRDAEKALAAKD